MIAQRMRDVLLDHTVRLWAELDADARTYREQRGSTGAMLDAAWVLLGATLCLIGIRYLGDRNDVARLVWLFDSVGLDAAADQLRFWLRESPGRSLNRRVFWCVSRVLFYGLVPALIVRFVLRARLRDYGFAGATGYRTYVGLFLALLPVVVLASYSPAFQAKYPYYTPPAAASLWPNQVYWELLYASQFVALECFFRGFFLHGLKKVLGAATLFVPLVPYVMIHFAKPLPETIGSVAAGLVLGTLSLRTRSIAGGAGLHVAVAWSMDALALWHRGRL